MKRNAGNSFKNYNSGVNNLSENSKSQDVVQEQDSSYEINKTENNNYDISLNNITKVENLQVWEEPTEAEIDNHIMDYISRLKNKIRDQAQRLSELGKYKFLCEKKIKQINPNQIFPITETNFCKSANNQTEMEKKSELVNSGSENFDSLNKNYSKLLNEYNELKNINLNRLTIGIPNNFPEYDKIQNLEKLRENYLNLLNSFNQEKLEKNEILEMLRKETLSSEEQRNFIEILKQAIESDLINSGFLLKYITLDNILDFNQIKLELDKFKNELSSSYNNISELQNANDELKFINENLMKNKDKIRRSLEEGIKEMERCKEKVVVLQSEREGLEEQINLLKESNIRLVQEKDEISKKNNNLTNKVKEISNLTENQNEIVINRVNEYRSNYEKLNKEFETLLKEKNNLEIKNSILKAEIEDLKNHIESMKETNIKAGNSIDQSIDLRSKNNEKLKEELLIKNEVIEDLKRKIVKLEENISKYIEIESGYKSKLDENNKYGKTNNKFDKYYFELTEKQKENMQLNEENKNLTKNLTNLENKYSNLNSNNQILRIDVEELSGKIKSLESKLKNFETEIEEKDKRINTSILENNKITKQIEYKNKESSDYKKEYDELQNRFKTLEDFKSDINILLYPIFSLLKVTINKYNSNGNEETNSIYTKNFLQNLSKLVSQVNCNTADVNEKFIIHLSSDLIKCVASEFDNIYDKLIDSKNKIKEVNDKLNSVENLLNEISQLSEKEKKYKNIIKTLKEEKIESDNNLRNYQQEWTKEINLLKKEREETFDEVKKVRNEVNIITKRYDRLVKENQKILDEFDYKKNNDIRYENNIIIFNKEKKYLENFLNSFVKNYPSKEVSKLMIEVININEFIYKTEREKFKIEEKIISLDKEYKLLAEDKDSFNNDLCKIVLVQKSNMKQLIDDYSKKILEKKEIQILIEEDINKLQYEVKNIFGQISNNENEIKNLQEEIIQYKNYFDSLQNTNSFKNTTKTQNFYSAQNNFKQNLNEKSGSIVQNDDLDISCLDSNIFISNNIKSKPIIFSDKLLTDYESIELDFKGIDFGEKKTNINSLYNKSIEDTYSSENTKDKSKYSSNSLKIVNEDKFVGNFGKNTERLTDFNKEPNYDRSVNFKIYDKTNTRRENIDNINGITKNNQMLNSNRRNLNFNV